MLAVFCSTCLRLEKTGGLRENNPSMYLNYHLGNHLKSVNVALQSFTKYLAIEQNHATQAYFVCVALREYKYRE